jgi:glucose/arabinose dehydrogenase
VFQSQVCRKITLAAAAVGIFVAAGCSNQPASEATSQPANQPAAQPAKTSPAPVKKEAAPKTVAVSAKATQPAQVVTVPKGTAITATMGKTLSADKNHSGDSFVASLSAPIKVDGKIVVPKGSRITGRVVTVKKHELKVALASVVVRGKSYDLATNSVRPSDKSKATLSAKSQLTFKLAKPVTVPVKG